ncbi:transcriptional regulator NrdR [Acetobacterium carbinolicum]|jgi:transcriptional repressor NrdR|uniref:transcriptional regulator NrdR n=1 Tax=Acetobacterium TaxID=33951 RepID=UPI000DBEAF4F|nr:MULTISPECIES: transcriptional regulator NrdR [unclassified Acetobacterium]AWW27969.1 transcriptional regulator NrdR [Acetobacterium sp. KB-1]MDK2941302.1 transcriptional repressor NrdR [Acetobacterium sp.]MDZ5726492.1 transcriptional regulator NrdR [Acetobacterium sp. K1/6]
MKCPYCAFDDSKVVDSRPSEEGTMIRRRRECNKCNKRFTTYERVENIPLIVVKKGGQRTAFDKNKIFNGMIKACEKRPVSIDAIKTVVDDLERRLYQGEMKEVPSSLIGEQVMAALKTMDQVAYVRFASVYRQFKDVASFMDELERLISEKQAEGSHETV